MRTLDKSRYDGQRRRHVITASVAAVIALVVGAGVVPPAMAAGRTFAGVTVTAGGDGYALVSSAGENYDFGTLQHRGNPLGFSGAIAGVATTSDGRGYIEISETGQVYAFGAVRYRGNPSGFSGRITGIAVTADGEGYVAVSSAGQVYAFGTVQYRGNPTGFTREITGIAVTADGQGYAAVSDTGQNYAYGAVRYRGNAEHSDVIVDVAVTSDGQGYINTSRTGQNYAFGTVRYHANPSGFTGDIVGVAVTADGRGYLNASSSGQVYAYGTILYRGNGDPGAAAPPAGAPAGAALVRPLTASSIDVLCAVGTRDLGTADGWTGGRKVAIRLCAIPGLPSSSEESAPGNRYSVAGANREGIVNSRASGAVLAMVRAARAAGKPIAASSTYRTYDHQTSLWVQYGRNPARVGRPGYSNHQLGFAIDFQGLDDEKGCAYADAPPLWTWLQTNGPAFGYRQYVGEHWHWDANPTGTQRQC